MLDLILGSAPWSTRYLTTSRWPLLEAQWRGVFLFHWESVWSKDPWMFYCLLWILCKSVLIYLNVTIGELYSPQLGRNGDTLALIGVGTVEGWSLDWRTNLHFPMKTWRGLRWATLLFAKLRPAQLLGKVSQASSYFIPDPALSSTLQIELQTIHRFSQSRRRLLLGPSPGWKHLLVLSHLRHY